MAAEEADIELINMLLDGELSPGQEQELRARIERDALLAGEFDRIRADRVERVALYRSFEGDELLAERVLRDLREPIRSKSRWRFLRPLAAAAAAAVLFFAGWVARDKSKDFRTAGGADATTPVLYHVAISDDEGRIVAVQKFKTLKEAQEFSEDLRRWQERQEQLFSGQPAVRSASF